MTDQPLIRCSCGRHYQGGQQCEECSREADRLPPHKRGYDRKWRKCRLIYLQYNPMCAACGRPAQEVDHIRPHKGDKRLFWDSENWQSLCKSCHSRKTQSEMSSYRQDRYVVCGPPGSGKTTWVRQNAPVLVPVWDLDEESTRRGWPAAYDDREAWQVARLLKARSEFIYDILRKDCGCYMIVTESRVARAIAHRLKARLINMETK